MKRKIGLILTIVFCLMVILSVSAQAETYHLGDTDLSIQVDDSAWYVFTRDNIKNNSELEQLEISYEDIYDILYDNGAYMDAVLIYEDGNVLELFVRKKAIDAELVNLSNYDDDDVLKLAKALADKHDIEDYSVYKSKYKFAKLEYVDSNLGYYVCEYVTCVNKDNYTFTFQFTAPFSDFEYEEMEKIVDSAVFDVDTTLKEAKTDSIWDGVFTEAISGAIAVGIVGAITAAVNKKKKKNKKNAPDSGADTTDNS